jgi:hypothetical protein
MIAERALYYPYTHIRDPEWLKATLLLFSQVRRMTPVPGVQADDGPILKFTQVYAEREPLLVSAFLGAERVAAAQIELAERLRNDAQDPQFRDRFGQSATQSIQGADDCGFQVHQAKLHENLKSALWETGLAWRPGSPEPYDPGLEYVELNPRVGEAVMATIAVACAMGEGLDIVGDSRSGLLHDCLTRKQPKDVYDTWLKTAGGMAPPPQPYDRELFEFVVTVACDTTNLDIQKLAEMGENREPIRELMRALGERANNMVAMDRGKDRAEQFRDETADILRAWKANRANAGNYWKRFFGFGVVETGGKLLEKFIDTAAHIAPGVLTGGMAGLLLHGALLASGAGVGIGLFTHAAKTNAQVRAKDRESPYRYLTLIEKAGVAFRTDLREGH